MAAPGSVVLGRRYALEEKIGAGGSSEVWRGTDVVLARPVAIKLLHLGYAQHAEALARCGRPMGEACSVVNRKAAG